MSMEKVLRAFAEKNLAKNSYYPVSHGQTSLIKPLALAVKKPRSIFLRPFSKSELIVTAHLEDYLPKDKKEEFMKKVIPFIQKESDLGVSEETDQEEGVGASSSVEVRMEALNVVRVSVEAVDELGALKLGKLDQEYVKISDLNELLTETPLDTNRMKRLEKHKLRVIYNVIYSELFQLKGKRGHEVTVDATLEAKLPQTEIAAKILAAPSLKAFYKKNTTPLKIATRNKRGPIFFKCVRVDYDKETGKLNLGKKDIAGKSARRSKEEDNEYQETVVGSEIDQSSWTDGDLKKIEKIKEAVLMSSVSREKRKGRVRKYLQWFERALDENKTMLILTEPLTDEDRHFMKEIFLPPSHELIVDLSSFETEKIQGYAIVLKHIDDLSDEDWDDIEKAWAEAGQEK